MKKLSDVKEDLEALSGLPEQNFRRNAGKQFRQIRLALIFAAVLFLIPAGMLLSAELRERAAAKKELAWEKEHFPEFSALYQDGRYEELAGLVEEALDQEQPVWNWRHYSFAMALITLRNAEQCRDLLEQAEQAAASGVGPSEDLNEFRADLLFFELRLEKVREIRDLSEQDLAYLIPLAGPWAEDRKQRFPMAEEALKEFYLEDWYVDYDKCREYVQRQTSTGS